MPRTIPTPEEIRRMPAEQRLKYEIAQELGLMDRVRSDGWKSLTAREAGKIGGLMTKRRMEEKRRGK